MTSVPQHAAEMIVIGQRLELIIVLDLMRDYRTKGMQLSMDLSPTRCFVAVVVVVSSSSIRSVRQERGPNSRQQEATEIRRLGNDVQHRSKFVQDIVRGYYVYCFGRKVHNCQVPEVRPTACNSELPSAMERSMHSRANDSSKSGDFESACSSCSHNTSGSKSKQWRSSSRDCPSPSTCNRKCVKDNVPNSSNSR